MLGRIRALICWLAAAVPAATLGDELRVAVPSTVGLPYLAVAEGQAATGALAELAKALGERLRLDAKVVVLPVLRIEGAAAAGDFDLLCHASPGWARTPDAFQWGPGLYAVERVLVGSQGVAAPAQLDKLPDGQVVGTTLGTLYPELKDGFAAGRLKRDDAVTTERLLKKLSLARVPLAVADRRELEWLVQADPELRIASWRLPVETASVRCALPKGGRMDSRRMMAALESVSGGAWLGALQSGVPPQLALVVSARSRIETLSRQDMQDLFLGSARRLASCPSVSLYLRSGGLLKQFVDLGLRRDLAGFRSIWSRLVFSGRGAAPLELDDAAELKSRLASNPCALGFVRHDEVDANVKVLMTL